MGEVKTLILGMEHDTGKEFKQSPEQGIDALWKADRKIRIIGSLFMIHVSTAPPVKGWVQAELTLEPRITLDVSVGGEKSEPARVINYFFYFTNIAGTAGLLAQQPPNIVMFPKGDHITIEKDTTINLITSASLADQKGTSFALLYYIEA